MPDLMLSGPAGRLEAKYQPTGDETSPVGLFLHPHPQYGGTMNNKVVYSLYHTFQRRGFTTMRFNFRGVGNSAGTFDKGEGELSDAAAALDWLQQQHPNARQVWVAGFSFGAWIGMQLLMRRPEVKRFTMVAPPANMFDFKFLAPCPSSGLIVQGDADEVVTKESVDQLVKDLRKQRGITIDYHVVKGAGHFFPDGYSGKLMLVIDRYITHCMPDLANPASSAAG